MMSCSMEVVQTAVNVQKGCTTADGNNSDDDTSVYDSVGRNRSYSSNGGSQGKLITAAAIPSPNFPAGPVLSIMLSSQDCGGVGASCSGQRRDIYNRGVDDGGEKKGARKPSQQFLTGGINQQAAAAVTALTPSVNTAPKSRNKDSVWGVRAVTIPSPSLPTGVQWRDVGLGSSSSSSSSSGSSLVTSSRDSPLSQHHTPLSTPTADLHLSDSSRVCVMDNNTDDVSPAAVSFHSDNDDEDGDDKVNDDQNESQRVMTTVASVSTSMVTTKTTTTGTATGNESGGGPIRNLRVRGQRSWWAD
ncbi:hypothetical protein ACOMHN_020910 [Nucella lapillus]